jgi:hypothetical protein
MRWDSARYNANACAFAWKKTPDSYPPSGTSRCQQTTKTELCGTVSISLSLGFFRFQGLNGICETSKGFRA